MKKLLEYKRECESCGGVGIYIGLAERDGAGVVCHSCKGTGCINIKEEYNTFEGRKKSHKVKRVYRVNPGIVIGDNAIVKLEDFGGIPYEDWLKNGEFPRVSEDRKHTCPAWFYQSADIDKKPDWKECNCSNTFSSCSHFKDKEKCWERWDKQFNV